MVDNVLAHIKHRRSDQPTYWEVDVVKGSDGVYRGRVIVRVQLGAADPVDFVAPVCTQSRLRHGAFIISRIDENAWVLTPAMSLDEYGRVVAVATPFAPNVPIGTIALTAAPLDVADEIELLG